MAASRIITQARTTSQFILDALFHSLLEHKPADRCLRNIFAANHQLGSRDRRIIGETLFSVLRWWGWLRKLAPAYFLKALEANDTSAPIHVSDWNGVLSASWFLENRFDLPPSVMHWLREAGLYPELFADSPEDAPITARRKYLRPFFQKAKLEMPPLALEELLPEWVSDQIAPEENVDFKKLVEWMQRRPPVWIRSQIADNDRLRAALEDESLDSVRPIQHLRLRGAFRITHAGANLRALPTFRNGGFEIQDLASQCVAIVCNPAPGEQWWDACAGGGGKALHLAWLMKNRGIVDASDLREFKLEELRLRARRDHFNNIRTKVWKGTRKDAPQNRYDGVLVDTPCSCSGTWRRTPDGRWNTRPESLGEFTALQTQLLDAGALAVKPGGTLVYSTCSMFRTENQAIVEAFLENHPDFILAPHENPLDGTESDGMTQIWPWQGDCDAMFSAKLTKRKTQ